MPDVFLSYARRDSADFVKRLNDALEADGIDVWVDLEDIPAASDWQKDLRDGVLQCDCFCFVVSPTSAASPYCIGELSDAESRNKRVIPLIHEPVAEAELPRLLQRLNWVPQRGKFEDDFDANLKVLAEAIRTDLEATRAHTRWEAAAAEWEEKGRDASLLPRGTELSEAESWIATQTGRDPAPTKLQAEFVDAARKASERRRRFIFGATAVALVVAIALGIVALLQRNEAREQRDIARSNELASAAEANLDTDPELSIILAKEAVETVDSPRTEQALSKAISSSLVRLQLAPDGHQPIAAASYSPDGELIVTSGRNGIDLWEAKTGALVRSLSEKPIADVAFTPDSKRLAAVGSGGVIEILDAANGAEVSSIDTGASTLYSVDVSPDGQGVAAAGAGGFAGAYDIASGDGVVFDGHGNERVSSVAYSPNSKVLVSTGDDGAARLWFAADAKQLLVLRPSKDTQVPGLGPLSRSGAPSSDAEFNPDGRSVATANQDGSVSLWSLVSDEHEATQILPEDSDVVTVAFDPQHNALLAGDINHANAYDLSSGGLIASYAGHAGLVNQINVSPDGDRVVTAGQDGTARVWDVDAIRFSGDSPVLLTDVDFDPTGKSIVISGIAAVVDLTSEDATQIPYKRAVAVIHVAFDPSDEHRIALAGTNGVVSIVDPVTGEEVGPTIDPPGSRVTLVQWSRDGTRLMTNGLLDGVTVSDTETGEAVGSIPSVVSAAALSPDGREVAYFGFDTKDDSAVRIVDIESGETVATLAGHASAVSSIAYSADGSRIVTASADATARIWDADSGESVRRLDNDGVPVSGVAISEDGRFVATTGQGLAVWNADTGRQLLRTPGFDADVALSPDGKSVALAGPGTKTLSVVDCDVCVSDGNALLALADERITREPTAAERAEYLDR